MPRLATIIICLLLSVIIGLFLIWPKYQEFRDVQFRIRGKETEIENQEKYFSQLHDISGKLKGYEADLAKLDSSLPDSPSVVSVLNFFQKTSIQNGLIFKKTKSFSVGLSKKSAGAQSSSQKTEEAEIASGIKEISIEFEVAGSYSALKNFISALERSARFIEVDSFFSSGKEEVRSFSLKIKAYSY